MDAIMQSVIIDNIFKYLRRPDIDRCQYVCRTWRESALRKLKNCSAIDRFQSFAVREFWDPVDDSEDATQQQKDLITINRMRNRVEFNLSRILEDDVVHHWYLLRNPMHLVPKFEVDEAIKNFLATGTECTPRFTFIRYPKSHENIVDNYSFSYPAVLIKQREVMYSGLLHKGVDKAVNGICVLTRDVFPRLNLSFARMYSFFQGFRINRYIPGVKIIATDWADPQSPRPATNDVDYPIRAVLYLAIPTVKKGNRTKMIQKQLEKSKPIFSGGVLSRECHSDGPFIFLNDPKKKELKPASKITIAFAGKDVQSAIHAIDPKSSFEERLKDFKHSLNFPTEDDRVMAILLDMHSDPCTDNIFPKIHQLFPRAVKIRIQQAIRPLGVDLEKWSSASHYIHLIRF